MQNGEFTPFAVAPAKAATRRGRFGGSAEHVREGMGNDRRDRHRLGGRRGVGAPVWLGVRPSSYVIAVGQPTAGAIDFAAA